MINVPFNISTVIRSLTFLHIYVGDVFIKGG